MSTPSNHRPSPFISAKLLLGIYVLVLLQMTLIPFDFTHAPTVSMAQLVPFWDIERQRWHSIPDLVQNLLLFLPLGFLGFLATPRLSFYRPGLACLLWAMVGFLLSFFIEAMQTMSVVRIASASDVASNTLGGLFGVALARHYRFHWAHRARRFADILLAQRPAVLMALLWLFLVAYDMWAPLLPTLDIGLVWGNLKHFLATPFSDRALGSRLYEIGLFFGFGAALCNALPSRGAAARVLLTAFWGTGVALAAELAQIFLWGHVADLGAWLWNSLGLALGAVAMVALARHPRPGGDGRQRVPPMRWALLFVVLLPGLRALAPFRFGDLQQAAAHLTWSGLLPFWTFFVNVNALTVANLLEVMLAYAPLGFVLARGLARGGGTALGVATRVGLLALSYEFLQLFVIGRSFDVTEAVIAMAGGLIGRRLSLWLDERRAATTSPAILTDHPNSVARLHGLAHPPTES